MVEASYDPQFHALWSSNASKDKDFIKHVTYKYRHTRIKIHNPV